MADNGRHSSQFRAEKTDMNHNRQPPQSDMQRLYEALRLRRKTSTSFPITQTYRHQKISVRTLTKQFQPKVSFHLSHKFRRWFDAE
jgi:hypothetical protein